MVDIDTDVMIIASAAAEKVLLSALKSILGA